MKDVIKVVIVCVFATSLLFPTSTFAYLDPGSGSMILQLILAGIASVAVMIRVFWSKIKGLLGLNKPKENEDPLAKSAGEK